MSPHHQCGDQDIDAAELEQDAHAEGDQALHKQRQDCRTLTPMTLNGMLTLAPHALVTASGMSRQGPTTLRSPAATRKSQGPAMLQSLTPRQQIDEEFDKDWFPTLTNKLSADDTTRPNLNTQESRVNDAACSGCLINKVRADEEGCSLSMAIMSLSTGSYFPCNSDNSRALVIGWEVPCSGHWLVISHAPAMGWEVPRRPARISLVC